MWVHGGGFTTGDKSSGRARATPFAKLEYSPVSINYRLLSPDGCGGNPNPTPLCQHAALEAQHDAQAAVRWLRANAATYRIDTDRIAMAGASAGAVTSVLAATHSEDPGTSGNPAPVDIPRRVGVGGTPQRPDRAGDARPCHPGTDDHVVRFLGRVERRQVA